MKEKKQLKFLYPKVYPTVETAWVSNKIGLIKLRWYSLICRKTGHHTNLNLKNKSSFA